MYRFIKPISKPSAASASSDAAASTSEAPTVPAPSTSTAPKQVPLSAASAPPQAVSDLNGDTPSQPILASYPKRALGAILRSFNPAWYHTRPWLEYSVLRDACFCFPCRKYVTSANERDVVFTSRGFNNWKAALQRDRGLQKHAFSHSHVQAAATWSEHKCREATGETIDCMLVDKTQLEKNQYYVKNLGGVVKFLCVNELGLRGTTETLKRYHRGTDADDIAAGLFLKLFEYTLEKDDKLADIAKGISKNAKYTSKDIQNEIIETLANMVLGEVRKRYANTDSAGFCMKNDGTRDWCNVETLSIMIRFVCNSMPEEHLIGLLDLLEWSTRWCASTASKEAC